MRGARNFEAGRAAEDHVARRYVDRGCEVLERRWRGKAGEVDMILRDRDAIVFVEVKSAPSHARAAESLSARQLGRIGTACEEYVARLSDGLATEMRVEVALVDGAGRIEVIENALM
ncbi:hypothetical protein E2L08_04610 [Palleronia sediminis]|uniref:Uncharacterized protein n=1 Tax=Palleronia sediminis TaxID=2547833 RepID=A0A4R6AD98_9RHOB|nr:hypothetical protein E2L08_04610 [Palleronia sediminis]